MLLMILIIIIFLVVYFFIKFFQKSGNNFSETNISFSAEETKRQEEIIKEKYGTSLNGSFRNFDDTQNILYLSQYDRYTRKVVDKLFKIDEKTIIFKEENDGSRNEITKEDLKSIQNGAQAKVYYDNVSDIKRKNGSPPTLEMVEIITPRPFSFPPPQ